MTTPALVHFGELPPDGHLAAFRPIGVFEATGREVEGHGEVWARYVGNTEQPEDAQQ